MLRIDERSGPARRRQRHLDDPRYLTKRDSACRLVSITELPDDEIVGVVPHSTLDDQLDRAGVTDVGEGVRT